MNNKALICMTAVLLFSCRATDVKSPESAHPSFSSDQTGEIIVDVMGMDEAKGQYMILLVAEDPSGETKFPGSGKNTVVALKVPARKGKTEVVFDEIPYGRYAIAVMHDINVNGKLDKLAPFLWPDEGFGFSNRSYPILPPSFEDAAITLDRPSLRCEIPISYFWRRYGYLPSLLLYGILAAL